MKVICGALLSLCFLQSASMCHDTRELALKTILWGAGTLIACVTAIAFAIGA